MAFPPIYILTFLMQKKYLKPSLRSAFVNIANNILFYKTALNSCVAGLIICRLLVWNLNIGWRENFPISMHFTYDNNIFNKIVPEN